MSYNGWSNRDTWAMSLNLTNDEYPYHDIQDMMDFDRATGTPEEEIADTIEQMAYYYVSIGILPDFRGEDPDNIEGVNWLEIVRNWG